MRFMHDTVALAPGDSYHYSADAVLDTLCNCPNGDTLGWGVRRTSYDRVFTNRGVYQWSQVRLWTPPDSTVSQ